MKNSTGESLTEMSGDLNSDEYEEKEGKNTINYHEKSKKELIQLLQSLQKHISEIKSSQPRYKMAEEALRRSEEKYRSLFTESIDGIYITNKDGILIDCNPAILELFGYTEEEMMGNNVRETYINPHEREVFEKEITKNGFVKDFQVSLCKKDDTKMFCLLNSITRKNEKGDVIGYQGIIRDISNQKRAEERIKKEEEKRRNVVINTTHLIHTPVTIIKGNLEMARMGKKELTPELLDMLIRTAEELSDLVVGELYDKIEKMTVRTSDGFTPTDDLEN